MAKSVRTSEKVRADLLSSVLAAGRGSLEFLSIAAYTVCMFYCVYIQKKTRLLQNTYVLFIEQ